MVKLDTRMNITNFFKLSNTDFEIDSKSVKADEKKAYLDLKEADIDGGAPDGKITYSEYLSYLNKNTPNTITKYDLALSKILPALKGFAFLDNGDEIASGVFAKDTEIAKDIVIPAGSKIILNKWNCIRVYASNNFTAKGLYLRGGTNIPLDISFEDSTGFFLASMQLAKDAIINGVPCQAFKVAPWGYNIDLYSDGSVHRAVLAGEYLSNDIVFLPGEKLEFDRQNKLISAVLVESRTIQKKNVTNYGYNLYDNSMVTNAATGSLGWSNPNVYFENGIITLCYEENKDFGKSVFPGTNVYQYASDGVTVSGMQLQIPYFLGYPVAIAKLKPGWDWSPPTPNVIIVGNQAKFTLDVSIEISGKAGKMVIPAGAPVTIDINTGNCIAAVLPDGQTKTYDLIKDQMKPEQIAVDQQPQKIREWITQWLAKQPKDVNTTDSYKGHMLVLENISTIEKATARLKCYKLILEGLLSQGFLVYKNNKLIKSEGKPLKNDYYLVKVSSKGLLTDDMRKEEEYVGLEELNSIGLDLNADGKIDREIMNFAGLDLFSQGIDLVSLTNQIIGLLDNNVKEMPKAKQIQIGKLFKEIFPLVEAAKKIDEVSLAADFNKFFITLSAVGVHPFADQKLYYLPNGTGDKLYVTSVELYSSGVLKKIMPDLSKGKYLLTQLDTGTDRRILGTSECNAPEIEFYENGNFQRIGMTMRLDKDGNTNIVRSAQFPWHTPSATGINGDPCPWYNSIDFWPTGKVKYMQLICGTFSLPGGYEANNPRYMRYNEKGEIVEAILNGWDTSPIVVTFPKGTKVSELRYSSKKGTYEEIKEFEKDTKIAVKWRLKFNDGKIIAYQTRDE